MAEAPEPFDLRRFAPPTGVTVTLRHGGSFRLPGDPDVDDVAVLLRLEGQINSTAGEQLAEALLEGKETLKRLILEADSGQDVSGLRIGPEEMLVVFALLVHGATVAEAVGEAITAHNTSGGEQLTDDTAAPDEGAQVAAGVGEPAPLPLSESSSSGRSSGSDTAGEPLRATG